MTIRVDAILTEEDLKSIEKTLYQAKTEELVLRSFININTDFDPYASSVSYFWYSRTGSAKIFASGASAKDVPFIDELGGEETQKVYDIVQGIRYKRTELEAMKEKRANGRGPAVGLDQTRPAAARRSIAETENKIGFVGNKKHKISGLLNHLGINTLNPINQDGKILWKDKTPSQILADLKKAKYETEKGNIFQAKVWLFSREFYEYLTDPYSEYSDMTLLDWLKKKLSMEKIIVTSDLSKVHNGLNADAFAVLDNDPEVLELAVPMDLTLLDPVYDLLRNSEQVAIERTAGLIIRQPSAITVMKGI